MVLEVTSRNPERGPRWFPSLLALCLVGLFAVGSTAIAQGPLPTFEFQGIALHPKDLVYSPNDDLIHPSIVKTEGRVKNPLGKYYLYHAPHKHIATSMAYSDSLDGPWTEYKGNPVVEGPSAPEIRWIEEHGKFFLWGHRKNSQTELWTSEDGLNFEYDSVSITARDIGTRNATYNRVYEYPLKRFGSRYITLYSGFIEGREIRCIWLAHSKDAKNWTQIKTPLVEPVEGDNDNLYGPSLLQWKGRNYVVYQDMTSWRGGNLKYVEIDRELNSVGAGGQRFVLVDPPSEPPLNDRLRGAEFYLEDNTLYLYSSASKDPRLIVCAKAKVAQGDVIKTPAHGPELPSVPAAESPKPETHSPDTQPESGDSLKTERARLKEAKRKAKEASRRTKEKKAAPQSTGTSLDDILKGAELETVYETTFDQPVRLIREQKLVEDGKYARVPAADVD